ncbi:MAG TPA: hypothetical protein PKI14_09170 [Fervidobacterium sp.]|nr:hypothetical protein [Fervidobacterium sp.]
MANESTSVGKIQLDIEISRSSLNRELSKLSSAFNSNFKNMFSQTTNFVKSSLDRMTNSFKTFSQVGTGSTDKISRNINKMNSDLEKTQAKIDETNRKLAQLYAEQDNIIESYRSLPAFTGMTSDESLERMLHADPRFSELTSEITRLENRLQELRASSEATRNSIQSLGNTTERTNNTTRRATDITRRFSREINRTGQSAKKSSGKIADFSNMIGRTFKSILRRIFIYNLIYKGIRGIIKYTGDALKTNKQFVHSLNLIKTNLMVAFQPIYDFILPALNALMKGIATTTTYIAAAISSLFGKSYEQSYNAAKSLNNAKKAMDGYGKAAKNAMGQLAGFDEINVLQTKDDTDLGGGGAGDFEMEMPDTSTIDLSGFDRFREIMASILEPFKLAWANEGQSTIDAMKNAFISVLDLIKSIGRSWAEVWTNGTGQKAVETILQIMQNIFNLVGNLATALKNAWNENEVGISIIQGVLDIFNIILQTIERITESTSEWAKTLDFSPLLESVSILLEALEPLTQNIGDGLVWLWENALQPLAGWVIEDALPVFLELLAEALNVLNVVLEALRPLGEWLWEEFLQPIAEWTGGVIISILEGITDKLRGVSKWIEDNQPVVETLAIIIGSFAAAWGLVNVAVGVWNVVGAIATGVTTALGTAIAFLTSPIGIAIAIIGSLIAIGVLLYQNWDWIKEKAGEVWESIKNIFERFKNWLGDVFATDWSQKFGMFGDILNVFLGSIKDIFDGVKRIFNGIIDFITGIFTGNWKKAWEGLKDILKGVADTFVAIVKAPINGIISLVNGAISGLNKIKIPDWVPGVGGKGINIPKIPMLAQGGYVRANQPQLAIIGDNKREGEIIAPESKITEAVAAAMSTFTDKIDEMMSSHKVEKRIYKIGESELAEIIIKAINSHQRQIGSTVLEV